MCAAWLSKLSGSSQNRLTVYWLSPCYREVLVSISLPLLFRSLQGRIAATLEGEGKKTKKKQNERPYYHGTSHYFVRVFTL